MKEAFGCNVVQETYGFSSNGAIVGWVLDKKIKLTTGASKGLALYPAYCLHGGDGVRHRTRFFTGFVIKGEMTASMLQSWYYGMKHYKNYNMETEIKAILSLCRLQITGTDYTGLSDFLAKEVKNVFDLFRKTEATPGTEPGTLITTEFEGWFRKKMTAKKMTILEALHWLTKSAHTVVVRRQTDVLYRGYIELLNVLSPDAGNARDKEHHTIKDIANAQEVMLSQSSIYSKTSSKKGSKR